LNNGISVSAQWHQAEGRAAGRARIPLRFCCCCPQAPHRELYAFAKRNTTATSRFILEVLAALPEQQLLLRLLEGAGWHKSLQFPIPKGLQLAPRLHSHPTAIPPSTSGMNFVKGLCQ